MTRGRKNVFAFKPGLNLHPKAKGESAVEQHKLIYKRMVCLGAFFTVIVNVWLHNRFVLSLSVKAPSNRP